MSTEHITGDGRLIGGVTLSARKRISTSRPIADAPLPKRLIMPLTEGAGAASEPLVSVGDRVLRGQPLAAARPGGAAVHASSSGTVAGIELHPVADPRRDSAPCVLIDCDGEDEPWPGLAVPDPADWNDGERLAQALSAAGLAGLGGAVYPTGVKIALGREHGLNTVIVNGAECEPYISCDDRLMREQPDEVLRGTCLILELTGCERAIIALEDDKREALDALQRAIETRHAGERVALATVPTIYPSGGERQLIQLLTGREVPSGGFPTDIGYLCQNVGTAAALARFMATGEPLCSRVVTVTGGGVAQPANLRVRLGTPIADLIEACGGYAGEVGRLIMGGGMTGIALPDDRRPVTRATNCVIAATPHELRPAGQELPCIRCGECSEACPAYLMPQLLHGCARRDDHAGLERLALFDCIECGCCDVVCPSHIPLTQRFRDAKRRLALAAAERGRASEAEARYLAREQRLARRAQEREAQLSERRAGADERDQGQDPIAELMERVRNRKRGDDS